jgi:hypothetical protein
MATKKITLNELRSIVKQIINENSNIQHKIGDTVDVYLKNVLPHLPIGRSRDEYFYNAVIKQIQSDQKTGKTMVSFDDDGDIYSAPIEDIS